MEVPDLPEIDPNFEPQIRARSNTWPLRPKIEPTEEESRTPTSVADDKDEAATRDPLGLSAKKTSSRRNAWGNLSYADLITKAIQSSPEQRLTLSQVYDWMVQNVPYFKDKGDSNSSAGWKNSIRHNLSLHNRFMRIQNEGTGKSSWWVINPDAKPGKTPRRRAASMETKTSEKKRIRVRQKMEAMRAAREGSMASSTSSLNEGNDMLSLDAFSDFRARTSSNASSIGRLSPIHSALENDNQAMPSPLPWANDSLSYTTQDTSFTEHLTESLKEMFVGESMNTLSPDPTLPRSTLSTPSPLPLQAQLSPNSGMHGFSDGNMMRAPPPYPDPNQQSGLNLSIMSPQGMEQDPSPPALNHSPNGFAQAPHSPDLRDLQPLGSPPLYHMPNNQAAPNSGLLLDTNMSSMSPISPMSPSSNLGSLSPGSTMGTLSAPSMATAQNMSPNMAAIPNMGSISGYTSFTNNTNVRAMSGGSQFTPQTQPSTTTGNTGLSSYTSSLLRQALTAKREEQIRHQRQQEVQRRQQQQQQQQSSLQQLLSQNTSTIPQVSPTLQPRMANNLNPCNPSPQLGNAFPQDIDYSLYDVRMGDLECDMDQIISQELGYGSTLDFDNLENGTLPDGGLFNSVQPLDSR